ncbi:hypothetical protein N665_2828s0003 [Sinapis alba]|nr:hypothetical protein N665_2828s0003 [Sinapis alba]
MTSQKKIRNSSASNETLSIQDLRPRHTTKLVHVKVLHSWIQNISGETMEFILADDNGSKIHATCKMTYIESKRRLLPVGVWRNIRNFHVRPATGAYRSTNHEYKMVFNYNTVITRSNHMNDELYLNLADFQTVLSGTLDENKLIDVLGQVLDCGEVETIQCSGGKQRKKLEFSQSDIKVTSKNGLKILIVDSEGKPQRQTKNVVFTEIFDNL